MKTLIKNESKQSFYEKNFKFELASMVGYYDKNNKNINEKI